ncbi:VanZ family protein [Sediminibacter sp. Hel_I_10]|uniref:VanZ family protein n=1 Tax=Sediminibacter sp. Hel_I_10 TaxID=1392490 RepID=UPI0006900AE8|nr:VanZ family protein [Sediminibacter sp. Hel_I_10]
MPTRNLLVLKKWSLILVIGYATALTIGSLINTGGMPELGSSYDDKIYHFIAYSMFTILAYNYFSYKQKKHKILYAAVFVIVYGIVIEVLQHVLTSNRTLDAYDVLANSLGVLLAVIALVLRKRMNLKMNA